MVAMEKQPAGRSSLQAIEALNPGIDVRAVRPGQNLKLAP
jgi:hypothetical protein